MDIYTSNMLLNGLGQTYEAAPLPAHYLMPMSKTAINIFIGEERAKGRSSSYADGCDGDFWPPCLIAMTEIERANLLFVNDYITYDQLIAAYKEAERMIADIPRLPTFKEQLRNAGKFLIGTVTGFITAGPVGLFTGGATATAKIVAESRAKAAANASAMVQSLADLQKLEAAKTARVKAEAALSIPPWALWVSGGLTAALLGYSFVSQHSK